MREKKLEPTIKRTIEPMIKQNEATSSFGFGHLQQIKRGLCIALAVLVLFAVSLCVYQSAVLKPQQAASEQRRQQELEKLERQAAAQAAQKTVKQELPKLRETGSLSAPQRLVTSQEPTAQTETCTYRLAVKDGCLQVYIAETDSFYMDTTIVYDLLPEAVQAQVDSGKYFDTEERLLEFLESYSS